MAEKSIYEGGVTTEYIVRYHWTGPRYGGWTDSLPFETVEEANRFVSSLEPGEPWRIIERRETLLSRSTEEVKHGQDDRLREA